MREVVERWRAGGGRVLEPAPATRAQIERIHAPGYVDRLASAAGHPAVLDLDTYMSPGSWDAAILAAGAVITAVDDVMRARSAEPRAPAESSGLRAAFAMVRPPGHHALRDRAMGFCLLNNVAIAVSHALDRGPASASPSWTTTCTTATARSGRSTTTRGCSSSRSTNTPSTRRPARRGSAASGAARGSRSTSRCPPAPATPTTCSCWNGSSSRCCGAYAPQLLVLDAGFDAHDRDPLAHMHVTTDGFRRIAGCLRDAAGRSCAGRIVVATEGGYHLEAARADSLQATVEVLAGEARRRARGLQARPTRSGLLALELVRAHSGSLLAYAIIT